MPFFYVSPVIRSMMVKLKCPHCGKQQVRGRRPEGEPYRCQRCGKEFLSKQLAAPPEVERQPD